jgi:hypothetical protein
VVAGHSRDRDFYFRHVPSLTSVTETKPSPVIYLLSPGLNRLFTEMR